ncbi:hypothetical protein PAXRUDRAFT_830267, partial [Paxillus rubicundulus Ve08.2h10]
MNEPDLCLTVYTLAPLFISRMVKKPRDVPGVGCIQRKGIVQAEDVAPVTMIGKFRSTLDRWLI